MPKILIYCRSVTLVGWLYEQFLVKIKRNAYKDSQRKMKNAFIGMYHSETLEKIQNYVLHSVTNETNMRVVIATSALGCGVNTSNIMYVLHFGQSVSLVDYCQQIGRVGRGITDQCHAILYWYPTKYKMISDGMKSYLTGQKCLRTSFFTPFSQDGTTVQSLQPAHLCCSVCAEDCSCDSCDTYIFTPAKPKNDVKEATPLSQIAEEVKRLLEQYQSGIAEFEDVHSFIPIKYITGLTCEISRFWAFFAEVNAFEILSKTVCKKLMRKSKSK